jgi:serine/threonine protein kinase
VKICDFGYSKHDNRSVARSKVGTLTYMAPEVLQVRLCVVVTVAACWPGPSQLAASCGSQTLGN